MEQIGEFTLKDLLLMRSDNAAARISLLYPLATTHDLWISLIEDAVDLISNEFQKTRQERYGRDEDGLTGDVIFGLRMMGIEASHDVKYGGHCDIVIEKGSKLLWLAEAKIHGAYDWLLKGFLQLSTRYSNGMPGGQVGGMIIYCKNADVKSVMDKWLKHLTDNVPNIVIERCPENPLTFMSTHDHQVSGLPYRVRHTPIALHFSPEDK